MTPVDFTHPVFKTEEEGQDGGLSDICGYVRQDGGGGTRHATHAEWEEVSSLTRSCVITLCDACHCPSAVFIECCLQTFSILTHSLPRNVFVSSSHPPPSSRPHHSMFFDVVFPCFARKRIDAAWICSFTPQSVLHRESSDLK